MGFLSIVQSSHLEGNENLADSVSQKMVTAGFKALLAFSVLIAIIVVFFSPDNVAIALFYSFFWAALAAIALMEPAISHICAKIWASLSLPLYPVIIVLNGLLPATLVPVAAIVPMMLLKGWWRRVAVFSVAGCSFLVPLHGPDYDVDIWLRVCLSNVIISIMIYILITSLEKALVKSHANSIALKRALDAEQKAAETKNTFLATMSHEIRTPMNGVLGLTDAVLSQPIDERQRSKLEKIKRSGELLNRVLNDVLDLSKLDADKLLLEDVSFDLHSLVNECTEFFLSNAQLKGLTLSANIADDVPEHLIGDRVRIAQVINNLISNAIKFTDSGSVTISVKSRPKVNDNQANLLFCVKDSGRGISDKDKEHIFDAFTQANSSVNRTHGGTGLGLQIAKNLVEKMHGEIWVESDSGKGSAFYFSLNLTLDLDSSKVESYESSNLTHSYAGAILLVEDNEINQLVASSILSEFGVTVDIANDGKQAIAKARQYDYDLILMDINMPVMDGRAATRYLRREGYETPIVALTAAVLEEEVKLAMESGMDGFLGKPIVRQQLQETLEKYLPTLA